MVDLIPWGYAAVQLGFAAFELRELFQRNQRFRERRVGLFGLRAGVSDGQGLRGPGPRKGLHPLTHFFRVIPARFPQRTA